MSVTRAIPIRFMIIPVLTMPVIDIDLVEMDLELAGKLPWLKFLLEEVQALRNDKHPESIDLLKRVVYLEGELDALGAVYDKWERKDDDDGLEKAL